MTYQVVKESPLGQEEGSHCIKKKGRLCINAQRRQHRSSMLSEKREGSLDNPLFSHSFTFSSHLFFSPLFLLSFCFCDLHSISLGHLVPQRGSCGLDCDIQFVITFSFCYSCISKGIFVFFSSGTTPPLCHYHRLIGLASCHRALHRWCHRGVPPFMVVAFFLEPF